MLRVGDASAGAAAEPADLIREARRRQRRRWLQIGLAVTVVLAGAGGIALAVRSPGHQHRPAHRPRPARAAPARRPPALPGSAVASDLAARYGAPYLHAMTSQSQAETVRENHSAFKNVFQVCPTEVHYGPGFIRFLDQERARGWQPPNRRIAFVDTDMPSGQLLNARTVSAAERSSWEICAARTVPAIAADWASLTGELERLEPAAVMIAQFLAGELAAFQRFAAARLPATVIYAIYAPSVPEFLKVAGCHAEGIVWSTVTGTYDDAIGQRFRADYAGRYGQPPGWSHAGIAYDEIHLLARAWMAVPQPRDFEAVSTEIRRLRYRGVNGSYFLDNAEQSGLGFPDTTPDPSLGLAHLVLQVQDGAHRIISPAPYAESRFRAPGLAATTRPPG